MEQPNQEPAFNPLPTSLRSSRAQEAAQIVRTLIRESRYFPGGEDAEEGSNYVEPLSENAVVDNTVCVYPTDGYLRDDLSVLKDRTIWAIDGGILTWQFPNGRFLLGRAVLVKMSFTGYETVQSIHEFPVIPFILQPPLASSTDTTHAFDEIARDYLQYIGNLIPGHLPLTGTQQTQYFSDAEEFLSQIPREYYSADAVEREKIGAYIDMARNAAEAIAFLHALRYAKAGDIVMRDGRIHGNFGFLTGLIERDVDSGTRIVRRFIQSIIEAANRDVKIIGIIKRPVSAYCTRYFAQAGVPLAQYAPADTVFYHRLLEDRRRFELSYGKRSNLWAIRDRRVRNEIKVDLAVGRDLVNWFYQNVGLFYLKPRDGVPPLRVDFITYGNMYQSWINALAEEVFALCRGSGSPLGLPHPITIADNHAKVHRVELNASINEIIATLERSGDSTDLETARELRAYLDIRYTGVGA